MPRTLTLFFHGTDFHRDKDPNEVVTLLHTAVQGQEAKLVQVPTSAMGYRIGLGDLTHLILEGPGSDEDVSKNRAWPGKHNPIFETPKGVANNPAMTGQEVTAQGWFGSSQQMPKTSDFRNGFMGETPSNYQTSGRALGTGWEDNVMRVVWFLTHLKHEYERDIITVNMVGWSRGAVTAFMTANKIYEVFGQEVEMNIVAIDPVPGGYTSWTTGMTVLPPTINDLVVILALDDDRANFQPLDMKQLTVMRPTVTGPGVNACFLPLPGNHSDVVCPTKGNAPQSGQICLHVAYTFLAYHGTRFNAPPPGATLSRVQLGAAYQSLLQNMAAIKTAASNGKGDLVGGRPQERDVRKNRAAYVPNPNRFINAHHRLCHSTALDTGLNASTSPGNMVYAIKQGSIRRMGLIPV